MTEQEWLTSTHPERMFPLVDGKVRKLRLFACACCRQVWNPFVTPFTLRVVTVAEAVADGKVSEIDRSRVGQLALKAVDDARRTGAGGSGYLDHIAFAAYWACCEVPQTGAQRAARACALAAVDFPFSGLSRTPRMIPEYVEERAAQADLLRDIFGNPFQSFELDPAWLTLDVLALARGIYANRAFDRMPILADALQDAGCANDDILDHCRGPGPHVRGCWVVDFVLGQE